MKIIIIDDAGNKRTITCRKIEPSNLSKGTLIIDEGDEIVKLDDVLMIVN